LGIAPLSTFNGSFILPAPALIRGLHQVVEDRLDLHCVARFHVVSESAIDFPHSGIIVLVELGGLVHLMNEHPDDIQQAVQDLGLVRRINN
jgi:hypothetical protein